MCRFLAEPLLLRGQDGVGCIHARKIAQTSAPQKGMRVLFKTLE
jgi:hypothetical protein